jgi:hypothetical protein
VSMEHKDEDLTVANLEVVLNLQRRALENIYMLAKRERNRAAKSDVAGRIPPHPSVEIWNHVIRFCESAGCRSSVLRDAVSAHDPKPTDDQR